MTPNAAISSEIQKLSPSSIIEMFELDATLIGGSIYRFHAGKNGLINDLVWNGQTYSAFPIEASGFEWSGKGQLPRPRITVSNVLGTLSSMVLAYEDLAGCKVTRIRTLAKYLDAVNFAKYNYLLYSNTLNNPAWVNYSSGTAAGTRTIVSDPTYGNVLRVTKTAGANTDRFGIVQYLTGLSGYGYAAFSYARSTVAGSQAYPVYVDAAKSGGGLVTVVTFANNPTLNSWIQYPLISSADLLAGTASFYIWVEGPVGSSFDFAWPQLSLGSAQYAYSPTGSSWNPNADPTAEFARDIYYIDRKGTENKDSVEFELSAALDIAGIALPRRQIVQNYCPWTYRGSECGYTGTNYFDTNDNSVATLALDVCGKRLTSCRARFGQYAELPYGGFPAAGLLKV